MPAWINLLLLPGRVAAWVGYMFPGKSQVWSSGRRKDSVGIHALYSLAFYALAALVLAAAIGGGSSVRAPPPAPAQPAVLSHPAQASAAAPPEAAPAPSPEAPANVAEPSPPSGEAEELAPESRPRESAPSPTPGDAGARTRREQIQVALFRGSPGTREWRDGEERGAVTVGPTYVKDGRTCRGYSYTVARAEEVRSSPPLQACQEPGGMWVQDPSDEERDG